MSKTRQQRMALTRRESCDEEVAGDVFDLVARDAQRKLEEVALSAFPNSSTRIGGAEHFYVRESSDDDNVFGRGRTITRGPAVRLSRRNSSAEDISWAFKEMQEHAAVLSGPRDRMSTLDLDRMSIDGPPSDAMGLTTVPRGSLSGSLDIIDERPISSYFRADSPLPTIGESVRRDAHFQPESPGIQPIGEGFMPYIPPAPVGQAADIPYPPASRVPADTAFSSRHATPSPFGGLHRERDMSLERLRNLHRLRTTAAPPMLGGDLSFRLCPSPEHTKLEPDQLWDLQKGVTVEESNRDFSGQRGLWRGYCYSADKSEQLAPAERPAMISTPFPAGTPGDPFARAFSMSVTNDTISEEPEPTEPPAHSVQTKTLLSPFHLRDETHSAPLHALSRVHDHQHNQPSKGPHLLQGLDERLRKEKAAVDLEDKITAEFDDAFITQVYNYLSLGYPAMARSYDDELSKISRISVEELERDDGAVMYSLWSLDRRRGGHDHNEGTPAIYRPSNGKKVNPTGYIMLDSEEKYSVSEEDRTPRWRALKKYIYEWARQHPDLDAISPLAWGMQERRGSWGL